MSDTTTTPVHFEAAPREERRLGPRSKMVEIIYMNMQAENGGILLDISASGLGFQLASSMAKERAISFRLSAEGIEDLEISAEVAWLDDDRKRGGLRFGQLPEKVRSRIHRWAGIQATPTATLPDPIMPAAAKSSASGQHSKSDQVGRSFISEMDPYSLTSDTPQAGSHARGASSRALNGLPNPLRAYSSYRSAPLYGPEAAHRRRLFGAVAVPVFVLLLLAAGVFVFKNKRQVGASMIHVGESLSGESARQPVSLAPPAVAPSSNSSAPGPPEFATVAPQAGAPSTNSAIATEPGSAGSAPNTGDADQPTLTARQPDSGSGSFSPGSQDRQTKTPAEAPRAQKPDSSTFAARSEHTTASEKSRTRISGDSVNEDDGHTELALAQQYLRGTSVPKDRDMAAHLLWVAVGEGNPQAELELADLYLRTDGVPAKNCAQARILLSASSNSGNLEAGEKLAKLRDYGCR